MSTPERTKHEVFPTEYKCSACGARAQTLSNLVHQPGCEYVFQQLQIAKEDEVNELLVELLQRGSGTRAVAKAIVDLFQSN